MRPSGEPAGRRGFVAGALGGRRLRHLQRFREVGEVLARHGFAFVLESAGLAAYLPRRLRGRAGTGGPSHLRQALEELGPTFVKLGQILSLRADLLPAAYVEELSRLQDRVEPEPFELSHRVIEEDLGAPLDRLFGEIDPVPLASASLSQVYSGTLASGERIVVKVLRHEVPARVATDLEILDDFARLARPRLLEAGFVDPVPLVEEFSRVMRRELDFRIEARHISTFLRNFRGDDRIRIPRVYPRCSSARVLTMERLPGAKVNDVDALARMGIDRRKLARTGARIFLKMVLEDRFFHGDPHPGNILVQPDGRLALLDFGMVAWLSPELTRHLMRTFVAVVRQDAHGAARSMERMGIVPAHVDRPRLERDLQEMLQHNYGRPLSELVLTEVVREALSVVQQHRLVLPAELLLLARALVLLDGLARSLDPTFNPLEVAAPYARRRLVQPLEDPLAILDRSIEGLQEVGELVRTLPERVDRTLRQIESGRLSLSVRPLEAEPLVRKIERAANRLALAVVGGALGVAGATLWSAGVGPKVLGVPLFALLTVGGSAVALVWVAWGIWRSGRV